MNLYFITLFPDIIKSSLETSVIGRAKEKNLFSYKCYSPRDYSTDKHKNVDDTPYGGGDGMVLRADVLETALLAAFQESGVNWGDYDRSISRVLVTSASGTVYSQSMAGDFSSLKNLFIICGHYEGIDQRFIDQYCDQEVSIGSYILTGGELAAAVISDSILRLLPGALGSAESAKEESFSILDGDNVLVEYPHYTRPAIFNGVAVPQVLVQGNHSEIKKWRLEKSRERTASNIKK